jgi:hypothetical protein
MGELKNYVRFTSANPKLDFSFLYPGDWQVRESQGANYDEVFILGPRNRENTYSLALVVRVTPTARNGGQYANLEELITDYLVQSKRLAGFQKISRAQGYLAGVAATEVEISYTIPLPINTVNPKETRIVERRIFFNKGDNFYEVMLSAIEEDYYQYLGAFKDVVRTFEFRDDTTRRVYRPLVMPAPVQAVRESTTGYDVDKAE